MGHGDFAIPSGQGASSREASHLPIFDPLIKLSFSQEILLSLYYVPGTVLGARDTSESKKIKSPDFRGLTFQCREQTINKH